MRDRAPVTQWQSGSLLNSWLEVRVLPGVLMKVWNTYRNKKWVAKLYYPADAGKGDWYVCTNTGHKSDDEKKRLNSVFVEIDRVNDSGPAYNVGYVLLDKPINEFRTQFLKLTREAIAKVDLMNSLGLDESGETNKCAECDNNALADDFLCQDCRNKV